MWLTEITQNAVSEREGDALLEWLDKLIDATALSVAMDSGKWLDRKAVCQFLGIAPSTLSGWEKEKRVPRAAKLALGLMRAVDVLRRAANQAIARSDAEIVACDGRWLIVTFSRDADGLVTGRVLGEAKTEQGARLMAGSTRSLQLLSEASRVIEDMLERTENSDYIESLEELESEIKRHHLLSTDIAELRRRQKSARELAQDLDLDICFADERAGEVSP